MRYIVASAVFLACGAKTPPPPIAVAQPLPSHTEAPVVVESPPPPKPSEDGVYRTLGAARTRVKPLRPVLASSDNGNTSYQLMVRYARSGKNDDGGDGEIVMGGQVIKTNGYGSDSDSLIFDWTLSPADATRAAALLGIPRQDRHPIGDALKGTFLPAQKTVKSGQPVEIELTLQNPAGAPSMKYRHGGRQRGPRDDQFSFTVTRNGQPVAPIAAMNFGGLSTMPVLAPGGKATIKTDISGWADVTPPGHYVAECRWETEIAPGDVDPYDDAHRGDFWDKAFTGTVSFDVR